MPINRNLTPSQVSMKRLRRVASEPQQLRLMPPGANRSALLAKLGTSASQSALPTKLLPLDQGALASESAIGVAHLGMGDSLMSLRSTLRVNPCAHPATVPLPTLFCSLSSLLAFLRRYAYLNTFPPRRMEISELAQNWWKPLHGQDWRHKRQLPPVRRKPLAAPLAAPPGLPDVVG